MKRNNNINLKRVPPKFKSIIRKMVKIILAESKDTRAIVLIGSVADNTYKKSSDIDLVWAKSHKIGYKRQGKMEERLNPHSQRKIQLVPFTTKQIIWHFTSASTMAHSIQQGIVIYGKEDRLISELLVRKLHLPTREWMKHWFSHWLRRYKWAKDSIKREKKYHRKYCKGKCYCTIFDDIARVSVNFTILYLETQNIVPVSKTQIWQNIQKLSSKLNREVLEGIKLALKFSGKDKYLTLAQADEILISANYLKKNLEKKLANYGKCRKNT
jgi:predicted nucleotidyltransferase